MFIKGENKTRQEGEVKKGKAKQGMENKEKREKESNTVILCWRLNKQAGHEEHNIPVYLKVLLHRATTAPGAVLLFRRMLVEIHHYCFLSTSAALKVVILT